MVTLKLLKMHLLLLSNKNSSVSIMLMEESNPLKAHALISINNQSLFAAILWELKKSPFLSIHFSITYSLVKLTLTLLIRSKVSITKINKLESLLKILNKTRASSPNIFIKITKLNSSSSSQSKVLHRSISIALVSSFSLIPWPFQPTQALLITLRIIKLLKLTI